jgi:hypothetical protein
MSSGPAETYNMSGSAGSARIRATPGSARSDLKVERAAGVRVLPDDVAAKLGVTLAEIAREEHRVVGRVIEEQLCRLRVERPVRVLGARGRLRVIAEAGHEIVEWKLEWHKRRGRARRQEDHARLLGDRQA